MIEYLMDQKKGAKKGGGKKRPGGGEAIQMRSLDEMSIDSFDDFERVGKTRSAEETSEKSEPRRDEEMSLMDGEDEDEDEEGERDEEEGGGTSKNA